MNELVSNPFGGGSALAESAGGRQVQARENTEVLALAAMAKRFPRDQVAASDRIRNAFTRVTLAEKAQYQFARGGSDISGPSIRAAEAIAQQWGNMSNGWRELSRTVGADGVGVSEIEAYCTDYETVNRESIQFYVRHWRDTKQGGYKLKDERDIYELCANQAQRRKRACILAQIPGDVTEMAMEQAAVTLKSTADTSPEAQKKIVEAFAAFGVTKEHIEKRLQRKMDSIQPAQVVSLKRIYASLRDEMSEPREWFEVEDAKTGSEGGPGTLGDIAAGAPGKRTKAKPEPQKAPAKTLEQYLLALGNATGRDAADLELDEARDVLQADDLAKLAEAYRVKFPA
jgi:hypothetical protein